MGEGVGGDGEDGEEREVSSIFLVGDLGLRVIFLCDCVQGGGVVDGGVGGEEGGGEEGGAAEGGGDSEVSA